MSSVVLWTGLQAMEEKYAHAQQEEKSKAAQDISTFTQAMKGLCKHIFADQQLGGFTKSSILYHLNVITQKALLDKDQDARNYLIGVYTVLTRCDLAIERVVKRLKYSVFMNSKIMASLFALSKISFRPFALPKPQDFETLLLESINALPEDFAKTISTVVPHSHPLCERDKKTKATELEMAAKLLQELCGKASDANLSYALVALTNLISDAHHEQFIRENQILFGQEPAIETPKKNLLNDILQRAYIGNAAIAYHYFLHHISWLDRYTFTGLETALEATQEAIRRYITQDNELFNSVLDRNTLALFPDDSTASYAKKQFAKRQEIFNHILEKERDYLDDIMELFVNIIHEEAVNNTYDLALDKSAPNVYTALQATVGASSYFPNFNSLKRWVGWKTDWQKTWMNISEQWIKSRIILSKPAIEKAAVSQ